MKKEIFLAVLIGLVFGLIITYGIYRATVAISSPPRNTLPSVTPSPMEESLSDPNLTIISPEDETVITERSATITGHTLNNSYVVIFVNDEENITTPDKEGNFSIQANLESGSNFISVHALDEDGRVSKQEITVVVVNPSPTPEASDSADTED